MAPVSQRCVWSAGASSRRSEKGKEHSLRLLVFDEQNISMSENPNQQECAVSRNIDQEITAMRQEIQDLEKAIARRDPPLAPYTRAIAEAKIATLQSQIAAMKGESGRQSASLD